MEIYVISMSDAIKRRLHIAHEFSRFNLSYQFFDGLDKAAGLRKANELGICIDTKKLTAGEIGCMMSHISLWEMVVKKELSHMAIFEDDIHFGNNVDAYLQDEDWISDLIHVVKLEKNCNRCSLGKTDFLQKRNSKYQLRRLQSTNYGMAGYILSYQGAVVLLDYLKAQVVDKPIDVFLFEELLGDENLLIVQLNPALCIQDQLLMKKDDNFPSELTRDRDILRRNGGVKIKRSIGFKIRRELKRIKNQVLDVIYKTRIKLS